MAGGIELLKRWSQLVCGALAPAERKITLCTRRIEFFFSLPYEAYTWRLVPT